MGAALGKVDTDSGPPSSVPLQHFAVALVLLVFGALVGVHSSVADASPLAHVHLLLAGWVCVTIMGAMTQFVPVWSDVRLHSRTLARAALALVAVGVTGISAAFVSGWFRFAVFPGVVLLTGFWLFVYNIGRTLPSFDVRRLDVTERHFLFALVFFAAATLLGVSLAADYRWRVFAGTALSRGSVMAAHATLAVFGAVVTTVLGAMYQLVTMFTQTEVRGVEVTAQRFGTAAYPTGIAVLASGRLFGAEVVAVVGVALVAVALAVFAIVVGKKLHESKMGVAGHPMLVRYVLAVAALVVWLPLASAAWLRRPLSVFPDAATAHLLLAGFVAYVVVGTLYHVVPFLVWVESYSDLLGLEDVPMVDDLYGARLERTDLALTFFGAVGVFVGLRLGNTAVVVASGVLAATGYAVFAVNLLLVVRRHKTGGVVCLAVSGGRWRSAEEEDGA